MNDVDMIARWQDADQVVILYRAASRRARADRE
jgi:hypothetical protein